jgi:hypothetical protein
LAVLSTAGFVRTAEAKKPKVVVSIDGKGYKYRGRYVVASTGGVGTIIIATKPARPGKILRTIGFGCAYYLPNETFPLIANPDYCNGSLTETKVGGSFETKAWLAVNGVQVTFDSFDGTWATGTFSGVLEPLSGAVAPATYGGTFKVKVTQ